MSLMNITRSLIVGGTSLHMAIMRSNMRAYERASGAAQVAARAAQRAAKYAADEARGAQKEAAEAYVRYRAEAKSLGRDLNV